MEEEWNKLKQTSLGEDLYNYLYNRQQLPQIKRTYYLGDGVSGHYTPSDNTIELLHRAGLGTFTHEMGHAADTALDKQYYNRTTSWNKPTESTQFTEAYDKLKGTTANSGYAQNRQEMARRLSKEWLEKNKEYRGSNRELLGWALGNTVEPDQQYSPPNHLNTTLATEMAILLDLATREQVPGKKKPFNLLDLFK